MKKELIVKEPPISTYTPYGFLFSVIDEKMKEWVYNNFLNIRNYKDWGIVGFDQHLRLIEDCPQLRQCIIPQEIIRNKWDNSIENFIYELIDCGYYIYMFIDRFYCDLYPSYKSKHVIHELFIYGYDDEKKIVYVMDNFKDGKFGFMECPISQIQDSYSLMEIDNEFLHDIRIIQKRGEVKAESINIRQIAREIYNFLHSTELSDLEGYSTFSFGMDVYEDVKEYMKNLGDKKFIDVRIFHFLYERQKIMEERAGYLFNNGIISKMIYNQSTELEKGYFTLRNMVLKYNIIIRSDYKDKILFNFENMAEFEKCFLDKLLSEINKY